MNKDKTLKALGEEYIEYIKLNRQNIEICKEKIKKAGSDELKKSELRRTLSVLYEISRELKANSEHLIKYYTDNSRQTYYVNDKTEKE